MTKQAKRFTISAGLAMQKNIPRCFVAVELMETARGAVYVYGHGTSDPHGRCCQCGRTLTHPVSILVGIGPECGGHWWDESVLGPYGMTPDHVERLKRMVSELRVDTWLPKAAIKESEPVDEVVVVPADHKMLQPRDKGNGASPATTTSPAPPQKTCHLDPSGKFAVIQFPYDAAMVDNVRRLEGRRWDKDRKVWTAWASRENLGMLQSWGFSLDDRLLAILNPPRVEENLDLYFSLCPLYNNLNGSRRKGEENAQGSIPKNPESTRSGSKKSSEGKDPRNSEESGKDTQGKCEGPSLERKNIGGNKISDAQTRCEKEALSWPKTGYEQTRGELSRWKRSGTHRNSETDGSSSISIGVHKGILNPNKVEREQLPECTRCLQSRLCQPGADDSHRTRRGLPQGERTEGERQKEDKDSGSPWLDCPTLRTLMFKEMGLYKGEFRNLYDFQREGVLWLEHKNGRGLIGDSMGLGKTIQALGWLRLHPEKRVVVVVPASLKLNWEREARKWIPGITVKVLSGTTPRTIQNGTRMVIINYDILGPWMSAIEAMRPDVVIVDESHYIKNNKAQRTKAVKELAKRCEHQIFLTGTPITNRPAEFFTTLNLLEPREFSSWMSYVKRYCGAYQGRFGWEVGGATHTDELHKRLTDTVMIRRRKEDVLKDLPAKRRNVVPMEINNRAVYDAADEDLISWLKEEFGAGKANSAANAEALARFSYLKQLAAEGMLDMAVQWIKDSLDSNGKLVIFAVHHATIDRLAEELRNYSPVVVDGRVSIEKRQAAVDQFQKDPDCRLFIGNIRAAGVGITLTASSDTVFVELGWTPGEHDQAEDRVHRIGQTDSVNAWYLVAANTIMEEIAGILDEKRKVLDAVLDGKDADEASMLTELLRKRLGE